ncbi:MAG: hypothetical protein KBD01_02510 [Acidobacteria bacterium]|nr:hypothetical protein [Acidobacteriota bacterium]
MRSSFGVRAITLVVLAAATISVLAQSRPQPSSSKPGSDRVSDKLRGDVRQVYNHALQCTRELLGPYALGSDADAPNAVPQGEVIPRSLGPMVKGDKPFAVKEALACRDLESVALIALEVTQRQRSRAELERLMPELKRRFGATPRYDGRDRLQRAIAELEANLKK